MQAPLELGAPFGRDVARGERAETGRDAVVRPVVARKRGDHCMTSVDRGERCRGELEIRALAGDGEHVGGGERSGLDDDGVHQALTPASRSTSAA